MAVEPEPGPVKRDLSGIWGARPVQDRVRITNQDLQEILGDGKGGQAAPEVQRTKLTAVVEPGIAGRIRRAMERLIGK